MGLAAAKILNKVRQALRKPKKKSSEQESMNYRKKLSREENKRKNEDFAAGEKRPKSKKKADNVKQMSDARLKREKQLNNPYLTYEDRAKLLGGFKKGGKVKGYAPGGTVKRSKTPTRTARKRGATPSPEALAEYRKKMELPKTSRYLKELSEMRKAGKNVGNLRKGMNKGGMLKKPTNPGLKKLPSEVRNKMGYMKKGGSVKGKCRMDGIAVRGKTRAKERSK